MRPCHGSHQPGGAAGKMPLILISLSVLQIQCHFRSCWSLVETLEPRNAEHHKKGDNLKIHS